MMWWHYHYFILVMKKNEKKRKKIRFNLYVWFWMDKNEWIKSISMNFTSYTYENENENACILYAQSSIWTMNCIKTFISKSLIEIQFICIEYCCMWILSSLSLWSTITIIMYIRYSSIDNTKCRIIIAYRQDWWHMKYHHIHNFFL